MKTHRRKQIRAFIRATKTTSEEFRLMMADTVELEARTHLKAALAQMAICIRAKTTATAETKGEP